MSGRGFDPYGATRDYTTRRRGVIVQGDRDRQALALDRLGADQRVIIIRRDDLLGPFQRDNPAASGNNTYTMRRLNFSSSTAVAMETGDHPMPSAGRVVGGELWSGAACTAGTATLAARIDDNGTATSYLIADVQLNAVAPTTQDAALFPFDNGIPFAEGALLRAQVTIVDFLPNTADFTAWLYVTLVEPGDG